MVGVAVGVVVGVGAALGEAGGKVLGAAAARATAALGASVLAAPAVEMLGTADTALPWGRGGAVALSGVLDGAI